jgi:hypothetical protein
VQVIAFYARFIFIFNHFFIAKIISLQLCISTYYKNHMYLIVLLFFSNPLISEFPI